MGLSSIVLFGREGRLVGGKNCGFSDCFSPTVVWPLVTRGGLLPRTPTDRKYLPSVRCILLFPRRLASFVRSSNMGCIAVRFPTMTHLVQAWEPTLEQDKLRKYEYISHEMKLIDSIKLEYSLVFS
jgi:hypothetical protein